MTKKQSEALAQAQAQHYVLVGDRTSKLANAYWDWCKSQPWHPFIRVTSKSSTSRSVSLTIDLFCVHDESGGWTHGARPALREQMKTLLHATFERTKDRWARKGWAAAGSDRLDAYGLPLDVALELIGQLWPIITRPEHYVTWTRYVAALGEQD